MFSQRSLEIIRELVGQIRLSGNDKDLVAKAAALAALNDELAAAFAALQTPKVAEQQEQ